MSKIHYFQRYSSLENTVTNNTLQLLARIYNYSNSKAAELLLTLTGMEIEVGIEIHQQRREKKSIPDGMIIQRSFKVVIESKVNSQPDEDQLLKHTKAFSQEDKKILLLLTKNPIERNKAEKIKRKILKHCAGVTFCNITYEDICKAIKPLFQEHEYEMRDLVKDYEEYCNDANLFDQSKFLMRIVPSGNSWKINRQYGIYFHPSDRGYTRHQFVGIYKEKTVQAIWKIDSVFDIEYSRSKNLLVKKTLIQGRKTDDYDKKLVAIIKDAEKECGYDIVTGHRFFCGMPVEDTEYKKSSSGGIRGARFVNLQEVIGDFKTTSEVAQKLKEKVWE